MDAIMTMSQEGSHARSAAPTATLLSTRLTFVVALAALRLAAVVLPPFFAAALDGARVDFEPPRAVPDFLPAFWVAMVFGSPFECRKAAAFTRFLRMAS